MERGVWAVRLVVIAALVQLANAYGVFAPCYTPTLDPDRVIVVSAEYLGCFQDKFGLSERDLPLALFLEDIMTYEICEERYAMLSFTSRSHLSVSTHSLCPLHFRCAMGGHQYMGLQFGGECWCGNESYGKYGKVADADCNSPCSGKRSVMCGGDLRNSVFRVTRGTPERSSLSSLDFTDSHPSPPPACITRSSAAAGSEGRP
jgi:hypothetical protein